MSGDLHSLDGLTDSDFNVLIAGLAPPHDSTLMDWVDSSRRVSPSEVLVELGIARCTLYRWIKNGEFPKQTHYSRRVTGWPEWQVNAWKLDKERAA